jgi:hypothetical protein
MNWVASSLRFGGELPAPCLAFPFLLKAMPKNYDKAFGAPSPVEMVVCGGKDRQAGYPNQKTQLPVFS